MQGKGKELNSEKLRRGEKEEDNGRREASYRGE